jgi:hypothetical protein
MRGFGIASLVTDHSRIIKRQNRAEVGFAFGCLAENKTETPAQNTIRTGPDRDPPTGLLFHQERRPLFHQVRARDLLFPTFLNSQHHWLLCWLRKEIRRSSEKAPALSKC